MGNKLSSEGDFEEYLILASDDDNRRLRTVWGGRDCMSMEDFSNNVLGHPDIPEDITSYLYQKFCRGAFRLTLSNFILGVTILTKAPLSVREEFFFSDEYNYKNLPELRSLDLLKLPRFVSSIYQVLSGVTHFDEKEICDLEAAFSTFCGSKLRKITRSKFRNRFENFLPTAVIDGLFNVFDENGDNEIMFKEFVCGSSALFNGPENARLTYIAQIWDTNRRGQLTSDNLRSLFDFFQMPEDQRATLTLSDVKNSAISILDFVCWVIQHEQLSQRMILLSDEVAFFGFYFIKEGPIVWNMLCDLEKRLTLKDVDRYWIIPLLWWDIFVVSLKNNDSEPAQLEFEETIVTDCSYVNVNYVLRPNLVLDKDYYLVPSFVVNALDYVFDLFPARASIERRVLSKEKFLPSDSWPDVWGPPEDFPGDYFVEMYQVSVEVYSHSPPSKDWKIDSMGAFLHSIDYSLMEMWYLSRANNLNNLRKIMAINFDTTPDAIRFWTLEVDGKQSRTLISDTSQTYHDLGVVSKVRILVERRNDDMSWPEELIKIHQAISLQSSDGEPGQGGSVCTSSFYQMPKNLLHQAQQEAGIINMGNTCYMSAALQSVSNVTALTDYVLRLSYRSRATEHCLSDNADMSAEDRWLLASCEVFQEYAAVLHSLFYRKESVAPKELWDVIVDKTQMFGDRQQHDCQEFLQIFLDLLHVDLQKWNKNKKESAFIETPEKKSFGNDEVVCTDKENVLQDSDVVSLKTDNCDALLIAAGENSESDKVDEIVETTDLVLCKPDDYEDMSKAKSEIEKAKEIWIAHQRRENSLVFDLFNGQIRSSLRCLRCSDVSSTFDLISCINLPIIYEDIFFVAINMVRINDRIIRRYFFRVTQYETMADVKEMLANKVKLAVERIAFLYMNNQNINLYISHNKPERISAEQVSKSEFCVYAYEMEESIEKTNLIIAVNRLLSRNLFFAIKAIDGLNVETFDLPFYVQLPKKKNVTAQELYDFTLSAVRKYSIGNHYQHNLSTLTEKRRKIVDVDDGKSEINLDQLKDEERNDSSIMGIKVTAVTGETSTLARSNRAVDANEDTQLPFEISFAGKNPKWCATCHWTRFCRGCPVDANGTNPIHLYECATNSLDEGNLELEESNWVYLMKNRVITVDWKPEVLHLKYNYDDERPTEIDKETFAKFEKSSRKKLSLDDCFNEYVKPETLIDSKCEKCNMKTKREKTLALWRLPKILVIHLKRFEYVPSLMRHVKQTMSVEFPLDHFDLSKYLSDEVKSGREMNVETGVPSEMLYRCISVVNHYGDLDYGHYTSFIRRPDNRWFLFNDSDSKPVDIETEDVTNAYLLFYERIGE